MITSFCNLDTNNNNMILVACDCKNDPTKCFFKCQKYRKVTVCTKNIFNEKAQKEVIMHDLYGHATSQVPCIPQPAPEFSYDWLLLPHKPQ